MATIEASIALFDGATPTLNRIAFAAQGATRAIELIGTRARAALTLPPVTFTVDTTAVMRGVSQMILNWNNLTVATRLAATNVNSAVDTMTTHVGSAVDTMVGRVATAVRRVQNLLSQVDGASAHTTVSVSRQEVAQGARETVLRGNSTQVRNMSVNVDVGGVSNFMNRELDVSGVTEALTHELARAASAFAEGVC